MAFSGKSEQRAAAGTNYGGATATLTSSSVKGAKQMGDNGPSKLMGKITSKSGSASLTGRQNSGSPSGVAGRLKGDGFPSGPRWKRATEPGNLKPGTTAQAKNTTRMTPGAKEGAFSPKNTGSKPKALRGGG